MNPLVAWSILAWLCWAVAAPGQAFSSPSPAFRGTLKSFIFTGSSIYPGTRHNVDVYIPAEYDGSKPACVYVQQDGLKDGANHAEKQWRFLQSMDQLIAAKEMPVTIGIFVWPSGLDASMPGTVGVTNRSYEYDALGDAYARFLVEELLPFVAKAAHLNLSTHGNDRAIGGQSTGAAAAFNTAWERPDAFGRVYSCSGSFVAFRGGNELPTLIRKTEAKPIRAFLTVGDHDMDNCAGDWTSLNQEMESALRLAGYDYQFVHLHGGHCIGYPDEFPDAMRFIWKGWPAPVATGTSAPRVRDIVVANDPWKELAGGCAAPSSPVCNSKGEVFFIDVGQGKVMRIGVDGKAREFLATARQAGGLAIGSADELYSVSASTGKILSYDHAGNAATFADGLPGQYLLARPGGGLYVSVVGAPGSPGQIWLVGSDGGKTLVDSGAIKNPTGLALRPDQWILSVADGASHWVYDFAAGKDGTLKDRERYYWLHVRDGDDDAGTESICYDKEGHFYAATRSGVQVCAWDGPTQVILPMPDRSRVLGLCLGGPAMDTLYAFTAGKIWTRDVQGHAIGAFSPWSRMYPGKL